MKRLRRIAGGGLALVLWAVAACASAQGTGSGSVIDKASGVPIGKTIEGLLIDSAAGSVSAASLTGNKSEPVTPIENVRDFSILADVLDSSKSIALSITPARTTIPFPAIDLFDYAKEKALPLRLLGALTIGYAQGKSDISGVDYRTRAISVDTSAYWHLEEDPIVAVARNKECGAVALDALGDDRPKTTAADAQRLAQAATQGASAVKAEQDRQARKASRVGVEIEKAATEAYNACIDGVLKKLSEKWNRTRYALSYATGYIKPNQGGGDSHRLGDTLAVGIVYGFDGVKFLKLEDRAALALTVRRGHKEPVLDSLVTGPVVTRDSTLAALRISGGSSVFRGLFEWSNADASKGTATQRTFRQAIGVDYRVMAGLWLNLRYGKQRKSDDSGNETGSFLVLNYSPSATLGR